MIRVTREYSTGTLERLRTIGIANTGCSVLVLKFVTDISYFGDQLTAQAADFYVKLTLAVGIFMMLSTAALLLAGTKEQRLRPRGIGSQHYRTISNPRADALIASTG